MSAATLARLNQNFVASACAVTGSQPLSHHAVVRRNKRAERDGGSRALRHERERTMTRDRVTKC